jgi:hypothetical protein
MGIEVLAGAPFKAYMARLMCASGGLVGIFFAILATDPLRYGPMLPLAGWGLIFTGLICLAGGIRYQLPPIMFCGDLVFCIVTGVLILIFRARAIEEQKPAQAGKGP